MLYSVLWTLEWDSVLQFAFQRVLTKAMAHNIYNFDIFYDGYVKTHKKFSASCNKYSFSNFYTFLYIQREEGYSKQ